MAAVQIFLSYCWADSKIADEIYEYFKSNNKIELHRDVIDIKKWGSIKEYMQSISTMDFVILLISDAYLKSSNCMYEILEVMRDRNYKDKIFPAITNPEIYRPINRVTYVKYWEDEFKKLDEALKEISIQNMGPLNDDLKRCQDISSNIAMFLETVSDMNNPGIQEVTVSIEEKLKEKGLLSGIAEQVANSHDLFAEFGIKKMKVSSEPTDLEINRFVKESFEQIICMLSELCRQYEKDVPNMKINVEQVNTKTVIYQFYKDGTLVRGLKIFLSNMFSRHEGIGISDATMYWNGSNNSWNGMYEAKVVDDELKLCATMSFVNREKAMTSKEVVADIWKKHIQMYLERR